VIDEPMLCHVDAAAGCGLRGDGYAGAALAQATNPRSAACLVMIEAQGTFPHAGPRESRLAGVPTETRGASWL
jgi:hypothetical protein